jgi:hypothetical protein
MVVNVMTFVYKDRVWKWIFLGSALPHGHAYWFIRQSLPAKGRLCCDCHPAVHVLLSLTSSHQQWQQFQDASD